MDENQPLARPVKLTQVNALPAPEQPRCGPDQLAVTLTPAKPEFGPDEMVTVISTVRNKTAAPCYEASIRWSFSFKDSAGRDGIGQAAVADYFRYVPFEPGETRTQTGNWVQRSCTDSPPNCVPASTGDATASVRWDLGEGPVEATTSFRLLS